MDCETCGRYRPTGEIATLHEPGGRLVMACARCRGLAAGIDVIRWMSTDDAAWGWAPEADPEPEPRVLVALSR